MLPLGRYWGFDDGPSKGTVLFPTNAAARAEILWLSPESKSRPAWIMVRGEHSHWRTPNGITLGSDLLTLGEETGGPSV